MEKLKMAGIHTRSPSRLDEIRGWELHPRVIRDELGNWATEGKIHRDKSQCVGKYLGVTGRAKP